MQLTKANPEQTRFRRQEVQRQHSNIFSHQHQALIDLLTKLREQVLLTNIKSLNDLGVEQQKL